MSHQSPLQNLSTRQETSEEIEVQCTDCYHIFPTSEPIQHTRCDSCGSSDIVKW